MQHWQAYQRWRPSFSKAVDEAFYPMPWLDEQVWAGKSMLFHTAKAAVLAEWRTYPSGALALEGLVCAGDLREIVDTIRPVMERVAIEAGAVAFDVTSREGWAKALAPYGFETYQQTVRKDLRVTR